LDESFNLTANELSWRTKYMGQKILTRSFSDD
jgi:hypothetical protein